MTFSRIVKIFDIFLSKIVSTCKLQSQLLINSQLLRNVFSLNKLNLTFRELFCINSFLLKENEQFAGFNLQWLFNFRGRVLYTLNKLTSLFTNLFTETENFKGNSITKFLKLVQKQIRSVRPRFREKPQLNYLGLATLARYLIKGLIANNE